MIVLQKDSVVQGLQDQVVNFLDHDYNVLQVCPVLLISKASYTMLQGMYRERQADIFPVPSPGKSEEHDLHPGHTHKGQGNGSQNSAEDCL